MFGNLAFHWKILIALVLGATAGYFTGDISIGSMPLVGAYEFFGQLFLNALKMIIVPLIGSSIALGVAGLGNSDSVGSVGLRTGFFYLLTTSIAIFTGLILVNLVMPGISDGQPAADLLALGTLSPEVQANIGGKGLEQVPEIFLRAVPDNILRAAADNEMLALIFFSGLFGFYMSQVEHSKAETLFKLMGGIFDTMIHVTHWVMKFAPIGVFGLVAAVVAKSGFDAAKPLLIFSGTVVGALVIHAFLTLPLMLRAFARVSPMKLYKAVAPALLTAFSTSSSSATLPITMDNLESNAGVSNDTTSFVLPLGATVNMNGTALYECMAAMFIAQAYGFDLAFTTQLLIVIIALVTSIGVAGVPSASLVAIAIILAAVGLPMEAIGVLLVFDRFLDMSRTAVNVLGDACCAVIVANQTGEKLEPLRTAPGPTA
jgi:Na+/H+-dicarboxylate symporter